MANATTPKLGENKMGYMPIGKLLFTMALPLAISMLVQAFYNVVDSYYVSQIKDSNGSAIAALGMAFPIQHLMIGCATGVGVGTNALLSKSLGEGNRERANQAAGNGIFLSLCFVVAFMVFGFVGAEGFYSLQSNVATTVQAGKDYLSICCIFCAGIFVEIIGERLLQASGRTVYTLFTQGLGAVLNIILDPIFIFGFAPLGIQPMGIAGAAIATVIGQWVAAIMAVIFNFTVNPDVSLKLKYAIPRRDIVGKILTVGIPSIIMMAIGSVMTFGMNQILQGFEGYGETPVTVFGIYYKLQSFVLMPLLGINNASVPILAYNYGARKPERITKLLKCALLTALVIMAVGIGIFQLFPDQLMGIFQQEDPNFMILGRSALRIVSIHFPIAVVGICLSACFQALGNGIYSTIVSLCRQLIALLPAAFLLSLTGNVNAVWWAFPIAEIVSSITAATLFLRIYKRKIKPMFQE